MQGEKASLAKQSQKDASGSAAAAQAQPPQALNSQANGTVYSGGALSSQPFAQVGPADLLIDWNARVTSRM